MFARNPRAAALLTTLVLLGPGAVACGDDSPTEIEDMDDGTDPVPGSVETERPEES